MSTPESEPSPDLAALGAAWSASVEMGPMEAMMWRAEADPRLRSTITTVEILDRVPDWDRLLAAHDWASRIVPRFRQRVVEPPFGLGSPTWVTDAEVDFAYHMNRIRLSGPGTMAQLIAEAQSMAMRPFDRARPLWEAALVEGLEGGRAGYILKSHHSVSDGIGGMQVLGLLHSRTREPMVDRAEPAAPPSTARGSLEVLAEQAVHRVRNAPGEVVSLTGSALGLAGRILRRPDRAALGAARYAGSLGRVASPPAGEPSPLLHNRGLGYRFEVLEVPLADLKAAGKAGGGSLNDAYLAAVLGGFRRYHEHFGVRVETMPMGIPISLRGSADSLGGNRFAGARFAAPVGEPDPSKRMRQIREFVLNTREEPAIDATGLLAPVLSRLPAPVLAWISGSITSANDVQASNVPGIPWPVYLAGAQITRMYPFGPLPGCAAMITLISHNGTCCIGMNLDATAVQDTALLRTCMEEGLQEVLALVHQDA